MSAFLGCTEVLNLQSKMCAIEIRQEGEFNFGRAREVTTGGDYGSFDYLPTRDALRAMINQNFGTRSIEYDYIFKYEVVDLSMRIGGRRLDEVLSIFACPIGKRSGCKSYQVYSWKPSNIDTIQSLMIAAEQYSSSGTFVTPCRAGDK